VKTGLGRVSTFTARYTSRCGNCDEVIGPGDEAAYDGDEVVHGGCVGRDLHVTPSAKVCDLCWTEHAGECF
jgi:hypothetical protein